MFLVIVLLFSFVSQINAMISVKGFLEELGAQLRGNYRYRAARIPNVDSEDIVRIKLHDGEGYLRYVRVYDPTHILMDGNVFRPRSKTTDINKITMCPTDDGTRTVGICAIGEDRRFCFKKWPEVPGFEGLSYAMYEALFFCPEHPVPMPKSQVILMNGKVFLVSEYIKEKPLKKSKSKSLKEFLENPEGRVINTESLQKLAIYTMLSKPEDCRLQNCLVRRIPGSKEYEVILIDNERSFGRKAIVKSNKGKRREVLTRVHSVIFAFREALTSKTLIQVDNRDIDNVNKKIKNWCDDQNKYLDKLGDEFIGKSKSKLNYDLKQIFKDRMHSKTLKQILYGLDKGKTIWEIFEKVQPELYKYYNLSEKEESKLKKFGRWQRVLKRIIKIDTGRHATSAPLSSYHLAEYHRNTPTISRHSARWRSIGSKGFNRGLIWVKGKLRISNKSKRRST